MTVAELIEKLKEMPQDGEIDIPYDDESIGIICGDDYFVIKFYEA